MIGFSAFSLDRTVFSFLQCILPFLRSPQPPYGYVTDLILKGLKAKVPATSVATVSVIKGTGLFGGEYIATVTSPADASSADAAFEGLDAGAVAVAASVAGTGLLEGSNPTSYAMEYSVFWKVRKADAEPLTLAGTAAIAC